MKSTKYLQLFDENEKPILSSQGVVIYPARIKTVAGAIKWLKRQDLAPEGAKFAAIHQTILHTIKKITGLTAL